MVNTIARIKIKGKKFEIIVDLDKAIEFKNKGEGDIQEILQINSVFYDSKKGTNASESDLQDAFGHMSINEIAEKIIKEGEILLTEEHRDKEKENKINQIAELISKNSVDSRTNQPYTQEKIKSAITQAGINIENKPIQEQVGKITDKLKKVLPLKIQTKKLLLRIPAVHTGKVYGIIKEYKEKEEWLQNGDLECVINLPTGMQMDFYDKLNSMTYGSVVVEEIKE